MHKQALIVVAIGVYIASAILIDRCLVTYVKTQEERAGLTAAEKETLEDYTVFRKCLIGFHSLAVFCLIVWFVEFSRRAYRYKFAKNQPPCDDEEVVRRLSGKVQLPFQFGILTLLAAMLAVAIVCSAYRLSLLMR
jgi:hypothetical protein